MPKAKAESLHIKSKGDVKNLDKVLSNGCVTVAVVLASWCGACKRALPMWIKQLKKKNQKNIVLVDNEQLPNTSLNSLNITHFPSTFEIPAGGKATLLSNPQDEVSLNALVNSSASGDSPRADNARNEIGEEEAINELDDTQNDLKEISASDYVNMMNNTPRPTVMKKNSMGSRDGFTPSLEKLKGGRRTKSKQRSRRRRTHRR